MVQYTEEIENGQSLSTSYTYGAHGTDSTITWPGGFQIKKLYQNGYLREIQSSHGALIWRLDSVSPFGGPKKYTLGTSGLLTRFVYDDHKGYLQKKTTGRSFHLTNRSRINWCIMNCLKKSMGKLAGEANKGIPQIKRSN